jgi:uncharacterized SAM-binding protein YcdF (DUF218 family)
VFFSLSRIAWFVLAPSHLVLWWVLAAAALLLARRPRAGRACAVLAALVVVVFGLLPISTWLARGLEDQYPRGPLPAHIDGILTLGGGLDTARVLARHAPAAESSEVRLVSTYELARLHPEARVVFSGGWGRYPDSEAARYAFAQMGLDPRRLTLEDRSRDTFENLAFSQRLVHPLPGETWVLATSAIQLPRAMAVAQRLGWKLIPWPTDYLTAPNAPLLDLRNGLNVTGRLALSDAACHEWLGLIAYQASGMSGAGPPPLPAQTGSAIGARELWKGR